MDRGSADAFTELGTIGIEEEFYVVDADGRPTAGTDTLVYESDPPAILDGRIDHELFKCVIETQTPKIQDPDDIEATISAVREALTDHAQAHGYRIAAAGLHPAGKWRELEHAEKPRYKEQLDRIQYPQHRNITAGLHVHIGVDDADKATWIANELRWYVAPILALSVNSPYWYQFDTGLQSARATIFESLPNTGIPTAFEDFDEYLAFERRMIETGAIRDRGELWFDVRPHSAHGTVEVRSPDTQGDARRVAAFVRYIYALVMELATQYDNGATGTEYRREILDENKWRALRYGHDASFIRPDGTTISLGTLVEQEYDRLGVDGIRTLYDAPSGAEQQRTRWAREGLDGLCEALVI